MDTSDNLLSGTIASEIVKLSGLSWFLASSNQLMGTIPSEFSQFQYMRSVWLDDNALTGTVPVEVCAKRGLRFQELTADYRSATEGEAPLVTCPGRCCTLCCDRYGICFYVAWIAF